MTSLRDCIESLHLAQRDFYAGGSGERVRELLTEDIVWTIPGRNAIAGRYEGIEQVMAYFERRRDLASRTFQMHTRDPHGRRRPRGGPDRRSRDARGAERRWSTVGLYRVRDRRIAACWLLPLDGDEFDRIWAFTDRDAPVTPR